MRQVIAGAVDLFAKSTHKVPARCFNEPHVDWQLSLSDALHHGNTPKLKVHGNDAVFFFRMTETFPVMSDATAEDKENPRVFLAGIIASITGMNEVPYVFQLWDGVKAGWRHATSGEHATKETNPRCDFQDEEIIASFLTNCLDDSAVCQMPKLLDDGDNKPVVVEDDNEDKDEED